MANQSRDFTMETNNDTVITVAEVQTAEVSKLWPAILYTSLMMVISSIGNSVVCYVYGFRWQSTVTKIFIFCLAALDLTNSLICMPTEIALLVKIVTFDVPGWCKITRFLTYTLNGSSSLILVAIAFDRWYKVCRPLTCFFTHRRAKVTCLGAVVLASSLSWPSLVLYGNLTLPIMRSNATGMTCLVSDDYIDTWWPFVFYCIYFTCYLCLVIAITVLYSMIAVKLVRLKKQQKVRMEAQYAALRSSKLMFPSQECLPLTADEQHEITGGNIGENIQNDGDKQEIMSAPVVFKLPHSEEDLDKRRSVTFRLPRKSNSEGTIPCDASGKNAQNWVQIPPPQIVIRTNAEEEQQEKTEILDKCSNYTTNPEVDEEVHDDSRHLSNSAEDVASAENLHNLESLHTVRVQSTENLPGSGCSESSHLLSAAEVHSCSESHGDAEELEQGIHFTSHSDLAWRNNPITDPVVQSSDTPETNKGNVNDISCDTVEDEVGSCSSLLSEQAKKKVVNKTRSDSFTLCVPQREGEPGKARLHKTTSDSNLVVPEKHQTLTSSRRSFLMPSGGYPGGRTPTSRLPTPTDTPNPQAVQTRAPLLSSKLLVERLNKKMAYRPAKTTRMLFAISIVFVVSFFPFFCVVLIRAAQGRAFFAGITDAGVLAVSIFIRSSFISNAANPVIYGLCNKQFRTECGNLLKHCSRKRRDVTLRVIEATDDVMASNS